LGLGLAVLTVFKLIENRMRQDRLGKLEVVTDASGPEENEIRAVLESDGFRITSSGFAASGRTEENQLTCELRWRARVDETQVPASVHRLRARHGVVRVAWTLQAR
jgi:hypothetical protein